MGSPTVPAAVIAAAVEDYHTSGDNKTAVAARHGISRTRLAKELKDASDGIAYIGGWETVGGIQRPLFPERRTA